MHERDGLRWAQHTLHELRDTLAPALAGLAVPWDEAHATALLQTARRWLQEYDRAVAVALSALPPAPEDDHAHRPS